MKKSKFTERQITHALKEYEAGKDVVTLCRGLGSTSIRFTTGRKTIPEWMLVCYAGLKNSSGRIPSLKGCTLT